MRLIPRKENLLEKFKFNKFFLISLLFLLAVIIEFSLFNKKITESQNEIASLLEERKSILKNFEETKASFEELKNQDQLKRNNELEEEIKNIQETYQKAVSVYEDLLDLKPKLKDTKELDKLFAQILSELSKKDFASAKNSLSTLSEKIKQENAKIVENFTIPQNIPQSNSAPEQGYSRQTVNVEGLGNFMVSIVAANLSSTRVIVDTASDTDCSNNCPVLPLATFVSRNGAYAGINGTYFCPAEYPTCAGKTNSFDLLVMNYKKHYFNSDNNIYSSNPGVIFGENYIRFVSAVSQWGRDTSPNGVLSNFPLLIQNNQVVFGGDEDPKKGSKGGRSFVANKGNTVYIGVVHNATVSESARVLKQLGMENALNLDDGGSTALWSGGYKVGPGRNIANAILFVKK